MQIKEISIKDIKPYKNNPRNNEKAIDKVVKSIEQFGFKVPLVIDKNNEIVAGHTRYKAAEKLGFEKLPCVVADDLTEKQIKAFRIADNKVSDYSIWDNKLLLEELEELEDIFTGFEFSDYYEEDLQSDFFDELESNKEIKPRYEIIFSTENKETMERVKTFIESVADIEEYE